MKQKPQDKNSIIIGICGRSCSGKTSMIAQLEKKYKFITHINQDRFFKANPKNKECPSSIRFDRLIESIKRLKARKETFVPSHRYSDVYDQKVKPKKIIIVEGFLLFVNSKLNKLFDKKIFIEVSDLNILYRRTKRVGNLSKLYYTINRVIPESKKYEAMQKKKANKVIDGNGSIIRVMKELEKEIVEFI